MVLLESKTKKIGYLSPNFSAMWVDNNYYWPDNFNNKSWLAVIFACNHCPYAIATWPIIIHLQNKYPEIGFICINSNNADYIQEDSFEFMQILSKSKKLQFPIYMMNLKK